MIVETGECVLEPSPIALAGGDPARGEGTFKIFGAEDERGYLDKYSIAESIDDETTIPIKHMLAPSRMTVPAEQLDREFFELAGSEGVTDVEELNKVLDRAVRLRTFLTADNRIEQVAAFIAEHFKESVLPLGYKSPTRKKFTLTQAKAAMRMSGLSGLSTAGFWSPRPARRFSIATRTLKPFGRFYRRRRSCAIT
jgi:hypothetical protein